MTAGGCRVNDKGNGTRLKFYNFRLHRSSNGYTFACGRTLSAVGVRLNAQTKSSLHSEMSFTCNYKMVKEILCKRVTNGDTSLYYTLKSINFETCANL